MSLLVVVRRRAAIAICRCRGGSGSARRVAGGMDGFAEHAAQRHALASSPARWQRVDGGMLAEGVCEVPRRAEGARRSANWVPSMVVRGRGPVVAYGGTALGVVSLCRRLDRDVAGGIQGRGVVSGVVAYSISATVTIVV